MAGLRLRELLRHRRLALFGATPASGIHACKKAPETPGRVVSCDLWAGGNIYIIKIEEMLVPKTVLAAAVSLAVAAVLLSSACSSTATVKAAVKSDKERKAAPEFTLKDADGKTVHLSDYRGKVVLLDFWATWCGPCKVEIPWFMEFQQEFKDKGFAVLGVSMDEDGWTAVKPYIQQLKVNYRIVLGNDMVGDQYGGVDSLPTTFLIDRQGRIASTHVGLTGGKDDFKNDIAHLLETPRAGLGAPARGALAFFTRAN